MHKAPGHKEPNSAQQRSMAARVSWRRAGGWQEGESRAAAVVSLWSKQCGCRCFSSPSNPEWRTLLPALVWAGGTGSTGAQQRCRIGVLKEGQRHKQTPHGCFCYWLHPCLLPQASLIRTSTAPMASNFVWAGIQHCLADPK